MKKFLTICMLSLILVLMGMTCGCLGGDTTNTNNNYWGIHPDDIKEFEENEENAE